MNNIEAKQKHPDFYNHAMNICRQRGVTMHAMRNSVNIADIAIKNGIIMALYRRNGRRASKAIADVTNTTCEYVKRVIDAQKEKEVPVKTWRYG